MKTDPFRVWTAIQDELIALQGRQIGRARSALARPSDPAPFRQGAQDAAATGARVWQHWVDLWLPRP